MAFKEGDKIINREKYIGETNTNSFGTIMKIIKYNKHSDIIVEFQDEHKFKKKTTYGNFKKGQIKNPYDKTIYGIACLGEGEYLTKGSYYPTKVYTCWLHLIERCCVERKSKIYPAYYGTCEVCQEWMVFQNFARWWNDNYYVVNERLHLDKDILFPGNKIYSPKTCLLVPQRINMLFLNKPNKNGLPNGIRKCKDGYSAIYNQEDLGIYSTVEKAYTAYAKKKKETIIQIADEYKGIIPDKLYNALYEYEVDIHNDKNYVA